MKRFYCISLCLIFVTIAYGQNNDKKEPFEGEQIGFTVKHPVTEVGILLKTTIPKGWEVNPDFGTVVFRPGNADDYYEPPLIEYQALCEGEAKADVIPENIDGYIQRLKDGWKRLATGNEELDKLGANVEILKEEKSEGRVVFEVKLTYPEGVSVAMYPPRYYLYYFLYNDQDPFFILIKGQIPVNLADEFLAQVRASCLTTVKK